MDKRDYVNTSLFLIYQEAFFRQQASYFEILSFKRTVMQLLLLSKILWQAPLSPIKWAQKAAEGLWGRRDVKEKVSS